MQLDIFEHSRDTMLRNDVIAALERHDAPAARAAWQTFAAEFAQHTSLPPLAVLVAALEQRADTPFADHGALRGAHQALSGTIEPAALQVFGAAGVAWAAPLWRQAARRAAALAFHAACEEEHCAPLWLRAGDGAAAAEAVARIASWRGMPAPLAWMTEARYRTQGLDAAWPLLAELAWLAPERFDGLTRRLADPLLMRLRRSFDASFDDGDEAGALAWFPAWLLTEASGLAGLLRQAQPSRHTAPERAMHLMLEALTLERQGRHRALIDARKALRETHASLWAAYIKTR